MHCARAGFDQIGTVSLRGAPRETKQSRPDGRSTARKCSALLAMAIRGSRLDLIEACARRILYGVLSTSSVALILAGAAEAEASAHSSDADLIATTVVLRGSTASDAQDPVVSDGGIVPTVLRGSPLSAAASHVAPNACPLGLDYDPSYGCLLPGYAYAPDNAYWPDYGFWPYYGFSGVDGGWRRGLRHGFAHDNRRARAFRLGRRTAGGFALGFAHAGRFGRR